MARGSPWKRTILRALREVLTVTLAALGRTPISYGVPGGVSPLVIFFKGATSIIGGTPLGSSDKAGAEQPGTRAEETAQLLAGAAGEAIDDGRSKPRRSGLPRATEAAYATMRLARPIGGDPRFGSDREASGQARAGARPRADHRAQARLERTPG